MCVGEWTSAPAVSGSCRARPGRRQRGCACHGVGCRAGQASRSRMWKDSGAGLWPADMPCGPWDGWGYSKDTRYSSDLESCGVLHRPAGRRKAGDGRMPSLGRMLWPRPSGAAPCRMWFLLPYEPLGDIPSEATRNDAMHDISPPYHFWMVCRHVEGADVCRMAHATGVVLTICHARPCPGACRISGIADG